MEKKTLIVGLLAGPGVGKSTTAADIFSALKKKGIDAELALEYAKELVWEKRFQTLQNQIYVFGKQYKKITTSHGQVDVIITDSPIIISAMHTPPSLGTIFEELVLKVFHLHNNATYYLERIHPYQPNGRIETEEEAKEIDLKIKNFLDNNQIEHQIVKPTDEGTEFIVNDIIKKINNL